MRATKGLLILAALTSSLVTACGPRSLSDADLTAYARTPYDAREMQDKTVVLGVHRGFRVLVEFPCSDLCPNYTTRLIHYDLPADATCTANGGAIVKLDTPLGTGSMPVPYCVPRVLAREGRHSGLSNNALQLTKPAQAMELRS